MIAELIFKYVEVLVWPAVVLVAIIVFRAQFASLFGRLTEASAMGATVKFDREMKKAAVQAEALPDKRGAETTPPAVETDADVKSVRGLMFTEWFIVEDAARRAAARVGIDDAEQKPVRFLFGDFQKLNVLSREAYELALKLNRLRNDVVHKLDLNLTAGAVDDFVAACRDLTQVLNGVGGANLSGSGTLSAGPRL